MLRFRALWQASLNATKKALTWNVEHLMPPTERCIMNFNSKEELKTWHLYSGSEYGGLSSASLEITDAGKGEFSLATFHSILLRVQNGTLLGWLLWNEVKAG